jgi:uncharacterized protein YkwD
MKKFLVVLAVAVSSIGFGQTIDWFREDSIFLSTHKINEQKLRIAIFNEINNQRKLNKLSLLTFANAGKNDSASVWGYKLIEQGIIGHDVEFINAQKTNKMRGENVIAFSVQKSNFETGIDIHDYLAKQAVTVWMNSPGHRAAILRPDIIMLAVGNAYGNITYKQWGYTSRSVIRFF